MSAAPTDIETAERRDIEARFARFDITPEQDAAMTEIRTATAAYVDTIFRLVPASRERSASFTSIEEGKYWANQSIAKNGVSQIDWTVPAPPPASTPDTEPEGEPTNVDA